MFETPLGERLLIRDDHFCFGCGAANPHGLHLSFDSNEDGSLSARWTPTHFHQGFEGIIHGGMISTVLDEVMGWVISNAGIWAVTARLHVNFRHPVEVGVETLATASVVAAQGRKIEVRASLTSSSDDRLLADATGLFVRVPEDRAKAWQERYLAE